MAYGLSCPCGTGSPQIQDRANVPCIGRQSLNHWIVGEIPPLCSHDESLALLVWTLILRTWTVCIFPVRLSTKAPNTHTHTHTQQMVTHTI